MGWRSQQIQERLRAFRECGQQRWETDYSRLLIFVCGNLDEMYEDIATSVDDCDSNADIFHALTSKLSVIDVKRALNQRFKPEQVARLGNEHVIYPSLCRRPSLRPSSSTACASAATCSIRSAPAWRAGLRSCSSLALS